MPVPNTIVRRVELAHPPERVWAALTTAEGLGGWFGTSATVDLRPGGVAHLRWEQEDAEGTLHIAVVEPPLRFAYTWGITGLPDGDPRRTYVEFVLEPIGDGTVLTVTESGFAQIPDELYQQAYAGNTDGWRSELDELVAWLDTSVHAA